MLEIRTLGGLSLRVNGQILNNLGSHKAEAILVYLAIRGGVCKRNVLAAFLWPDSGENQALTSLRVALTRLRKDLDDYLEITHDTVGIKTGAPIRLDAADLENRLSNGEVEAALEVYKGDFLQGFQVRDCLEFEDWQRLQQERLNKLVTDALHFAISNAIMFENYEHGINLARRLLEIDPLDEQAHLNCMLLHALDGQRVSALEQYNKYQAKLQEELGVEPSQEVQSLHTRIVNMTKPGSGITLGSVMNLPIPQTSFLGREQELSQIVSFLSNPDCRLLTLLGPGGIGKTRLALRAASRCFFNFSDGSFFIPLEGVASDGYLVHTIADAIQFIIDSLETQLDATRQLLDYLKNRSILLVLDGFEHLISGGGLLSQMLGHAPYLKILVTSRQKMDLKGEWIFPVTGFPINLDSSDLLPNDSSTLRLFVERARQSNIEFNLSENDRGHLTRICRLVDGMPLGIELAAAWTPVLSIPAIMEEIKNNLDFLRTSKRDVDKKHHSIRATFDGSWDLLNEGQREVFCKLSIFQGGFDREAALGVSGVGISQVSSILDRSMLSKDHTGRFFMHGLLRQYGIEKLKALVPIWEETCDLHCKYYTNLLLQRQSDLLGHQMYVAWDDLRQEMDNIRTAIDWAVVHWDTKQVREILVGLLAVYAMHGWYEGKDLFNKIAQARRDFVISENLFSYENDPIYLSARVHQAFFLCNLGQIEECEVISRQCLEPLRDCGLNSELSECLHNLGVNASFRGDYESAMEQLEQAILLGKESQNIMWPTYLLWLGHAYFLLGEYEHGLESLQKCYEIFERQGNFWGMAFASSKMGLAADGLGEFTRALEYHRQALTIFDKTHNQTGKGYALSRMSESAYFLEDYQQAIQLAEEGFQLFKSLGHLWGICTTLCRLGFGYTGLGEITKAKNCFREALVQSRKYQTAPLTLYALAGMAATMIHEKGKEKSAIELFFYIRNHPQTPALCVQQTARWFTPQDKKAPRYMNVVETDSNKFEKLEVIVERILNT